ncbi:response regulator [Clostridium uliginosum]|uniref:Stage 0 sporulation protein A homolog n=1 Tax=Clostridium uliginosum TaxID=119641 RepID=A0A1I1NIK6_9CLOT|nr:response regulator [Clostridium uliginosum]SFC97377.1 Response regulator receiver domain-containing protein [Clostridium uliginosum]
MNSVLVVDDEKEIVELIDFYLKNNGYNTYRSFNGKEALDIFEKEQIDIIILDIMQYTEKQLFELSSSIEYSPETPYVGQAFPVEGKNGESYIFLCKIDRLKVEHSFIYKPNFSSKSDSFLSLKAYGTLYLNLMKN